MIVNIIGLTAASLTTLAFLPQVIKTWRTKSTADLSPFMFFLMCLGILFWLMYGLLIKDFPIIIANAVTICLAGTIMYYIFKADNAHHIHHIAILVNDIEKMKNFYLENFNAKVGELYHNPDKNFSSYFISLTTGTKIEIMHCVGQNINSNQNHIAISVGSKKKVDELTARLSKKGVPVVSNPRMTGDGYYESLIEDIEGNHIEITV
jgi:lactoylglutathione lyase